MSQKMNVGIDLGTTNSAMAWINPADAEDTSFPPIQIHDIPQLVAPGRVENRRTLPSFLFLEDGQPVGAYAREQGALVPTKLVHSAKSWLSNPDVDRTAKILPWDSQDTGRVLSPVEVSARILGKIRDAWDTSSKDSVGKYGPLADQHVVLTVPASFDEEARELTVMAAQQAGLPPVTLLEEPAAAFYSWIAGNLTQSRKLLYDGQIVLICDVGGGTSDFSLIKVSRDGDKIDFTRTAVGKHLLLGGDNLDLTLAWLAETKLGQATPAKPLSIRQRSALRRQCSAAKERLLTDPTFAEVEITIQGSGTSLIGGTLKTVITRAEALELTLEGFLPLTPRGEAPKEEKKSLFRELGLPYVADPAISRHLNAFLEGALAGESAGQIPNAILFNGGFFIPEICRTRVADVLESWYGVRPEIFENRDLDLAVARGAAYYSYVRSTGSGVLVRGGLPRTYYLSTGENSAVCMVPRGAEEGSTVEIDRDDLQLVANRPVSFRLFSSLTRTDDTPGQVIEIPADSDFHEHLPLQAVIRFGKSGERLIPIKLGARLTELGTLETWCDSKISDNRWRLQFELRKSAAASTAARRPATVVSEEAVNRGIAVIAKLFRPGPSTPGGPAATAAVSFAPEELPSQLEATIGLGRNSWPLETIRKFGDTFIANIDGRKQSPAFEARWLNLCGFCLRPGFGFPGDDFRIEQTRRIYQPGIRYGNQVQNEIEWWIFWGRIAGGLNRNQQAEIYQRLASFLLPRGNKKPPRINSSLLREMWRTASSLELLPAAIRTELGDTLIKTCKAGKLFRDTDLWCLTRLGARELFYGPINQVLPPAVATRWVEALIKTTNADEALASLARRTGDPTRDVSPAAYKAAADRITNPKLQAILQGDEQRDEQTMGRLFGEALPSGLVLSVQDMPR